MRQVRESEIERALREGVEALEGEAFKFVSTVAGVADRVVVLPYLPVYFVELKRPGGRLRMLQEKHRTWLLSVGHKYVLLDSHAEVAKWLAARAEDIAKRRGLYE